ncbi:MAG TPA: head GIN domain-containing protein [Cyclobacteriaceae bacterium]|nr:head GIN domain-containing protein [Cyclobacteriaceae bacterium]
MKKLFSLIIAIGLVTSVSIAQKRETRTVDTFTKISFRTSGKVYVKIGSPQKVEIEGSSEALEKVKTTVDGGKLTIGPEGKWFDWSWGDDNKVIVNITVANIEALNVSGSGSMIVQNKITTNNLDLNVSGSGSLEAEIDAADVDADVSGSGDMDLKGKCKNFNSDISGSGGIRLALAIGGSADFDLSGSGKVEASGSAQTVRADITGSGKVLASNMETDKCKVSISGSGDVEINVKTELDARISGSGSVSYKGNPARVNADSSGSGKVRKM